MLFRSEYCAQIAGGIPMSQGEIVRLQELGVSAAEIARFCSGAVNDLIEEGASQATRTAIAKLIVDQAGAITYGDIAQDDEMNLIREQFRKFVTDKVAPHAHEWHLKDELIPLPVVKEMCELGVFGLTIPEEFGGAGLGKTAMCVVSEELSRGYIGVGSLGTRSEIAAELILGGGTAEQKKHWLPKMCAGEVIAAVAMTEADAGSDLASMRTMARRRRLACGCRAATAPARWVA